MTNQLNPRRFRPAVGPEMLGRKKGSRYIDLVTGANVSRRQRENVTLQAEGLPKLSVVQAGRKAGFPLTERDEIRLAQSGLLDVWIRVWSDVRQEPTILLELEDRGQGRSSSEGREFYGIIKDAMRAGEFSPGQATDNRQAPNMERLMEFIGLHNSQKSLEMISVGTFDYPAEMNQRRRLVPLR